MTDLEGSIKRIQQATSRADGDPESGTFYWVFKMGSITRSSQARLNLYKRQIGVFWAHQIIRAVVLDDSRPSLLSRDSQGTVDEVKKQIELELLGSSKGRIQLVVLMNLHLKFRNKERTKEIQDLSQSLDMTNDDSRENRREPTRQ
ncbi:hypothetical protein PPACK8108_LOCUS9469 [Phakopsora pachyrhizi]|uniref:Uncharacterized protein n=1 Tax=Phakopsora pachyrhizi TaxID=170000 RepID=A0AAV0AX74_PHAPC|nr:hypothetical protein PPACK8108_LOCUS9469 [Phakopsora pachyrhizi]